MSKMVRPRDQLRVSTMAATRSPVGLALVRPMRAEDYRALGARLACSPPGTIVPLTVGQARIIVSQP